MPPKIEYRTLTDRAYEEIKKGLISSSFSSGQILVIRTLAQTYGISTTPVREALQRLVAERLLDLRPNHSIAVPFLPADRFQEILRIRCELEGLSASLAIEHLRLRHLNRLQAMIEAMDKSLAKGGIEYQALNEKFHFLIYEQAKSPMLLTLIQNLWSQVGPFFNVLTEDEAFIEKANEQHKLILGALLKRDTATVRRLVVADISIAADHMRPRLLSADAEQVAAISA